MPGTRQHRYREPFSERAVAAQDRRAKAAAVFAQVDRAHREWTSAQIEFLTNIQRLFWQWEPTTEHDGTKELLDEHFPDGTYTDVPGLCRYVHIDEIEEQGWSLNPGRYVGVKVETIDEGVFKERIAELTTEFNELSEEATRLTAMVSVLLEESSDQ